MVFVFTFAVGGGSGNVIPMPNWALVSFFFFLVLVFWFFTLSYFCFSWISDFLFLNIYRTRREIQIIVNDSLDLYI